MFQDIGKQVLNSSIRQGLQKGLGSLGAKLGIALPKIQRLDGQTEPGALWGPTGSANRGGAGPAEAAAAAIPGLKSDQQPAPQRSSGIGSSIAGFLGSLLGAHYSIDARGTDPVLTEQRTRVAIMAAHNSAVGTGFRVHQEHLKHTPQR